MKRLTALLLALALILPAASTAEGREKGYLARGIQEKVYAADTLPSGLFPCTGKWDPRLYREDPDTRTRGGSDVGETAAGVRVEWVSGDYTAEETEKIFVFCDGSLLTRNDLLNRPGSLTVRLTAESKNLRAEREFTVNVIDYGEEPVDLPDGTTEMYAQKGKLDAYTAAEACGRILPGNMTFVEKDMDGARFESPWVNLASADTYELMIRCEYLGACYFLPVRVYVNLKDDAKKGTDEAVTVKNFKELKKAITESCSNRIRIASNYKPGDDGNGLITIRHGRTVTITPEDGQETAVITGTLYLQGNARVVFDRVSIEAKDGEPGLIVEDGMDVTAVSVKGGDSKKGHGGPAVYVIGGSVRVGEARGGSSAKGMGGDAVIAAGRSKAEVGNAVGGDSGTGVGGTGAVAMDGAEVTVTGGAAGGNGGAAAGKGTLTGLGGTVTVAGTQKDGETTGSGPDTDPEEIPNDTMLQYALRSGKTDLVLSPGFSALPSVEAAPLFTLSGETVHITAPEGKTVKTRDMEWTFCCGKWEVSGVDAAASGNKAPLRLRNHAEVDWNGNVKSSYYSVTVQGDARLRLAGNAESNSKEYTDVVVKERGRLEMTGDVVMRGTPGALEITGGGSVKLTGGVNKASGTDPAVYLEGGRLEMSGTIIPGAGCNGLMSLSGEVLFDGTVKARSAKCAGVYIYGGTALVTGEIKGKVPYETAGSGSLFINGKECR